MKSRMILAFGLMLVVTAVPVLAKEKKDKKDAPAPSSASGDSGVAAYLGGEPITLDDVTKHAEAGMERLRQQDAAYKRQVAQDTYNIRKSALDQIVQDKLLAKEAAARSMTKEDLEKAEIDGKAGEPTQDEIKAFYDSNKARMSGKTLEQATPDIEKGLRQMKLQTRRGEFMKELQGKAQLKVLLEPPRVEVKVPVGWPGTKGSDRAPVTLVEFSDFQCPYCKRAEPTIEQLRSDYGDKLRFVYRDYPLPFHPRAMPASIAVHCAADQGKYWEMFNNLMHEQGDLGDDDLKKRAAAVGLDAAKFAQCFDSKKPEPAIKESSDDGAAAGVSGTPSFFVNGRMLVGARPIEEFKALIDEELARAGSK
jgi:protein-disulfide isomerase